MLEFLWDFVYKYFVVPGYDWIDTPTYGLVLGGLVIFIVIPVVKRLGVKLDRRFFIAVSPFMVFGATARELLDQNLGLYASAGPYPQNFWLVSPWIFFTMFFLALGCLIMGIIVERRFKSVGYHIPMFIAGFIFCAYNVALILLNLRHLWVLVYVISAWGLIVLLLWTGTRLSALSFMRREGNMLVAGAQLLDASATFVGMEFLGFGEQHVLPSLLIKHAGTAFVMFPLKLLVVIPALYVIDAELKNDETARRFLKFVVFVLGFGPAVRDITMMIL